MKTKEPENTQEWREKILGEQYNTQLNYYNEADLNWNMYNDNQWVGIASDELPVMQFNICKQATDYIISSIMSRPIKAEYNADNIPQPIPTQNGVPETPEDLQNRTKREMISKLSLAADMKWEKEKMNSLLRALLLDGAMTGDMCTHTYWDSSVKTGQNETGDFHTDAVDGANVMLGNPNSHKIEGQPYILVIGRDMVSALKAEAKRNKVPEDMIKNITSDIETEYQIGERGKIELQGDKEENGKATYVIKYWKDETGEVFWNKSTRYCSIIKDKKLGNAGGEFSAPTKFTHYPIAWANWRTIKHSCHGNSLTGGIVDNQIAINQMFAMVVYWMRQQAFGKVIIDASKITSWSNKIGEVIKADGGTDNIVKQLESGNFNSAILSVIELAVKYTKDFIGANDGALGQVNPEQASGTSIMMAAKQSAVPHANILENLSQLIEDTMIIWGDFFQSKYNNRELFYKGEKGNQSSFQYNAEAISDVILSCKVNVGPSTIWSEPLLLQNLDNLLARQAITPSQYYERIKGMNIIPDVQGLIADAKLLEMEQRKQKQLEQQMAMMQGQAQIAQQSALPSNIPELQGSMGATAQNSLKASQPSQG